MNEEEITKASALLSSSGRNKMRRAGGSGDESSKVCVDMISFSNIVTAVTQASVGRKQQSESQEI